MVRPLFINNVYIRLLVIVPRFIDDGWVMRFFFINNAIHKQRSKYMVWYMVGGVIDNTLIIVPLSTLFVQYSINSYILTVNTLRSRQNGFRFPDDIFKCIFWNENIGISIKISLKFVPNGLINNRPSLVQVMAWRRPGDKPLSEQIMVNSSTHICVTRPQWAITIINKYIGNKCMNYLFQKDLIHKDVDLTPVFRMCPVQLSSWQRLSTGGA